MNRAGSALVVLAALLSARAQTQVPSVVQVELLGESRVWTETHAVYETTEDAKFQQERYGADFHVRLHGLPAGRYGLKVGLAEMKFIEPGQRVFSLAANGQALLQDFDILTQVANYEACIKGFRVQLDQPVLDLHFTSRVDNAKYCYLRLYNDDFVLEVPALIPGPQRTPPDLPDAPYLNGMFETSIGKFGSRVSFNPRPRSRTWWQGALGNADYAVAYFERDARRWADAPHETVLGAESGAVAYALPFTEQLPSFPTVRQSLTPTTLAYTCRAPDLPHEVTFTCVAPFYPQDLKLSTAPYLRLDCTVRDLSGRGSSGTVYVGQRPAGGTPATPLQAEGLLGYTQEVVQFGLPTRLLWAAETQEGVHSLSGELDRRDAEPSEAADLPRDSDGRSVVPVTLRQPIEGFAWDFSVGPGEQATRSFYHVGWCDAPVLQAPERPLSFKYREYFATPEEVIRYAVAERETIERRRKLFDGTILGLEGFPSEFADLFSLAFQSWVMNSWYMADQAGDWFSVWEGCCKFHSTVDVEYNTMPFYFQYWPELARLTLDEWAAHEVGGIMPHDMGMGFEVGRMEYPHPMEVEEATNFVLLLTAYWQATGDLDTAKRHLALAGRLLDKVAGFDTDGDGFPDRGTANTVDQGSQAIQHGPRQVYLGVKCLAASEALAVMARASGDEGLAEVLTRRAAKTTATLDASGWLRDHYVVALKPPATGGPAGDEMAGAYPDRLYGGPGGAPMGRGWDGGAAQPRSAEPVAGWDGYSIYSANGLLYPLAYGLPVTVDRSRMRADLLAATAKTLKRFGSPHTDREGNTWISQNIWRDMVAAYLGLDMLDNVSRYWAFELEQNRLRRGCFTDVINYGSGGTSLDYYPRGVALAGLIPAAAGMTLDRSRGSLTFAPVRAPLRLPVTACADWAAERVPWATVSASPDGPQVRVEPPELLAGLQPVPADEAPGGASP